MSLTPEDCLANLKSTIDKLRKVEIGDIIKASDDNIKIDALKWIERTLDSMSDVFTYGDYLNKIRNIIRKLNYVKDCPFDYEECLKHPEYFIYSDFHNKIIDCLFNIKDAIKHVYPKCDAIQNMLIELELKLSLTFKPFVGDIVLSWLHNHIRNILLDIYKILDTLFNKCYLKYMRLPCWFWIGNLGNLNNTCCYTIHKAYEPSKKPIITIFNKTEYKEIVRAGGMTPLLQNTNYAVAYISTRKRKDFLVNTTDKVILYDAYTLEKKLELQYEVVIKDWLLRAEACSPVKVTYKTKCDIAVYEHEIYVGEAVLPVGYPTVKSFIATYTPDGKLLWRTKFYEGEDPYYGYIIGYDVNNDVYEEILIVGYIHTYAAELPFYLQLFLLDRNGNLINQSEKYEYRGYIHGWLVSNLFKDETPEVVVSCSNKLICLELPNFNKLWEYELPYLSINTWVSPIAHAKNYNIILVPVLYYTNREEEIADIYLHTLDIDGSPLLTYTFETNVKDPGFPKIVTADFDNDGLEEVVLYDKYHVFYLDFEEGIPITLIEFTQEDINNEYYIDYGIAIDIDGDNYLEFVGCSKNEELLYIINPIPQLNERIVSITRIAEKFKIIAVDDVNNDNKLDIIAKIRENGKDYYASMYIYYPSIEETS